jgi:polysaccharide export outer membrane protein
MTQQGHSAFATEMRTLHHLGVVGDRTDGQLLADFVSGTGERREAAFTVLIERHGPMVLGVCGDMLRDREDSHDASQATFLVLARKAASIRHADSLGSWLYGVARHVAARARAEAARRREVEREAWLEMVGRPQTPRDGGESHEELYQELEALPDRYRSAIVACDLEGLSHAQAARRLNLPLRTLQTRLYRGRERLRARLVRRGFAFAVGAAPQASISALCAEATASAAVRIAEGSWPPAPGLVSSRAADWSRLAVRRLAIIRAGVGALGLAALGLVAGGWGQPW